MALVIKYNDKQRMVKCRAASESLRQLTYAITGGIPQSGRSH